MRNRAVGTSVALMTLLSMVSLAGDAAKSPSAEGTAPSAAPEAGTAATSQPSGSKAPAGKPIAAHPLVLPGGGADGVMMDYLACDRERGIVWVPAGNTGSVDMIEAGTDKVTRVQGFRTAEVERRGQKRTVGPSSASIGEGIVYVGNRGDSSICAVDMKTRKVGACATLESMPDGVAYVAATREVWVTTPRDGSLTILDASKPGTLAVKTTMKLEGSPEGYAVDPAHGVFYTNLEDKDRTLAIDVKTRSIKATWMPECGEEGPRGLAVDPALGLLFVACTDGAVALDVKHDGAVRSRLTTGAGVDNIDYLPARRLLYVAAGREALLTVAHVGDEGTLTTVASGKTAEGARVVVADAKGGAYVADSRGGRILYFPAP